MASKNSNRIEVPEAKAAMNKFKTEVASELGVNLKEGYNGDLTSKEAGSIGGEMVRQMIAKQEEKTKTDQEYEKVAVDWFEIFSRAAALFVKGTSLFSISQ